MSLFQDAKILKVLQTQAGKVVINFKKVDEWRGREVEEQEGGEVERWMVKMKSGR